MRTRDQRQPVAATCHGPGSADTWATKPIMAGPGDGPLGWHGIWGTTGKGNGGEQRAKVTVSSTVTDGAIAKRHALMRAPGCVCRASIFMAATFGIEPGVIAPFGGSSATSRRWLRTSAPEDRTGTAVFKSSDERDILASTQPCASGVRAAASGRSMRITWTDAGRLRDLSAWNHSSGARHVQAGFGGSWRGWAIRPNPRVPVRRPKLTMRTVGVEPTPGFPERCLRPPRLPFRHVPAAAGARWPRRYQVNPPE